MSKVPPQDAQGPPSYSQAVSEGAAPPGPAMYQPPVSGMTPGVPYGPHGGQPSPYGAPPGAPHLAQGPQGPYGPPPGGAHLQQGPQGQYGPPPGQPLQQPQQYGQYGAPPGMAAPTVVVAPVQTIAMVGKRATRMMCPHCHADIETTVNTSPSSTAWVAGLIILLFGCWMGCCLIPCCMDDCMDKEHYCPNCKAFLGRYRN